MSAVAELLRAIAVLFVALMAPKGTMRRVRGLGVEGLCNLVDNLMWMHRRGRRFWYPGESLATAAARVELVLWISQNPAKAHRHLALQLRGWKRARHASAAPPSHTPRRLWCAPPTPLALTPAFSDSS
jgi:hypothetical protein